MEEEYKLTSHENICQIIHSGYMRDKDIIGHSYDQSVDKYGLVAALTLMNSEWSKIEKYALDGGEQHELRQSLLKLADYCVMTVMRLDEN